MAARMEQEGSSGKPRSGGLLSIALMCVAVVAFFFGATGFFALTIALLVTLWIVLWRIRVKERQLSFGSQNSADTIPIGGTRQLAGVALSTASLFLAVMAILIGSTALFYITTAMIATLLATRLQARLAVRKLRLERIAPASVQVGETVTVEITVWSEVRIPRPLISVIDNLPLRMRPRDLTPSLPIAPAYDGPIQTQYRFRASRRGKFRWSGVTVEGTDALGLITVRQHYETSVAEIVVLPRPIPVSVELPSAAGWGISEAVSGKARGAGIEPWGIRQYHYGDSLRHVHWRSTARRGQLLVKEFEAGSQAAAAFIFQRTQGTDIQSGELSSLDLMCGHVAYLAEAFARQGAKVILPGLDGRVSHHSPAERAEEVLQALALLQADETEAVSTTLIESLASMTLGSVIFVLVSVPDPSLPDAIVRAQGSGITVVPLLYDVAEPVGRRGTRRATAATSSEFVQSLQGMGVTPIVMPSTERAMDEVIVA